MAADLLAAERERLQRSVRRVVMQLGLYLLAAIFGGIGVGFLIASLYLYLHRFVEAWRAGVATGAIALVLAGLIMALAAALGRRRSKRPRSASRSASSQGDAAETLGRAAGEILSNANLRSRDAAMIALVSGILLGIGAGRRRRDSTASSEQRD